MGLDLTIKTKNKILHSGTGVFIRENGMNRELKTLDEVKQYFPNSDLSHIEEYEYYDDELFNMNITHNLFKMAENVVVKDGINLCLLLWKPKSIGFEFVDDKYIKYINDSLKILLSDKDRLEKYNPENGWGNYDVLLNFVCKLATVLNSIDLSMDHCEIISDV